MGYFLIFAGALLRLIPHAPNFAPIAAIALFGGTYLNKKYALIVPILALLASDYFLGFYDFWVMVSVYVSFLIIGLLGLLLRKRKSPLNIFGITITGSLLFFIITNFVVWATTPWYSKTFEGLIKCYWLAIPFLKNTVLGDLFYVGVLFGLYELIILVFARRNKWQKTNFWKLSLQKILKKK